MRKIFLIITLIFSLNTFSQGNLQFNRIIFQEYEFDYLWQYDDEYPNEDLSGYENGKHIGDIVVPNGKVTKITNFSRMGSTTLGSNNKRIYTKLGTYEDGKYITIGGYLISEDGNLPLWLPSGTHKIFFKNERLDGSYFVTINGIEFNVVQ
jgi:hypothetical protein